MTHDTTYNGWTNYATWRVNLELFDYYNVNEQFSSKPEAHDLADELRELAEQAIEDDCREGSKIALPYALAFLSEVNWYEIAESKIADWEES